MEGGLRIQTTAEADARCIAEALREYDATVEAGNNDNWHVNLSDPGPDYTALLGALQSCLDNRGIASVQIVMGDHTYLMTSRASYKTEQTNVEAPSPTGEAAL